MPVMACHISVTAHRSPPFKCLFVGSCSCTMFVQYCELGPPVDVRGQDSGARGDPSPARLLGSRRMCEHVYMPREEMMRSRPDVSLEACHPAGSLAPQKRAVRWQDLTGGRLWMWNVKKRRNRAEAAVRRFLMAKDKGGGKDNGPAARLASAQHPALVHAATFKRELRATLKRLKSEQLKDVLEGDTLLSEASTASTVADMDLESSASALSSADVPASPLEEICESVWDAVTAKAMCADEAENCASAGTSAVKPRRTDLSSRSGCVAIDCEMVGVGKNRSRSILARVAVVDEHGSCLMDSYVRPTERVTDYRTRWSGIRAQDLVGAPSFDSVRQRVAQLIRGKILVGHAIHNDLNVLNIAHPPALVRDTAFYQGLRRALVAVSPDKYDMAQCPSLKNLCQHILKLSIQSGEHCPVEDAASTMKLYVRFRGDWEAGLLFS